MSPESKEIAAIVDRFPEEARQLLRDAVSRYAAVLAVTEPMRPPAPKLRVLPGRLPDSPPRAHD